MTEKEEKTEQLLLEQRKVKALEKIANSMDALTIWFEEIDKSEWSDRIQFYLHEWHKNVTEKQALWVSKEEKGTLSKSKGKKIDE
jgi:hypothetical protein